METYEVMRDRQQKEFNEFPLGAAFSDKQFEEMMKKWGLTVKDCDKIYRIGSGMFVRKSDHKAFHEMLDRHHNELWDAIKADKTGDEFIYGMFYYELCNHEYCITYDYEETLNALGITVQDLNSNPVMIKALKKAASKAALIEC